LPTNLPYLPGAAENDHTSAVAVYRKIRGTLVFAVPVPHDSDATQERPLSVEDEHRLPLAVQHIIVSIHDFHLTHIPQKAFVFCL
jgi:hypothetical protein